MEYTCLIKKKVRTFALHLKQNGFIKITKSKKGRFQSGQMGRTVNPLAYAFVGSNPTLPTLIKAEVAQLVERQPSKL
jgi:hypothetical protein